MQAGNWDPWFSCYTFIPGDGIFYSPFGWGFYSPWWAYQAPIYFGGRYSTTSAPTLTHGVLERIMRQACGEADMAMVSTQTMDSEAEQAVSTVVDSTAVAEEATAANTRFALQINRRGAMQDAPRFFFFCGRIDDDLV